MERLPLLTVERWGEGSENPWTRWKVGVPVPSPVLPVVRLVRCHGLGQPSKQKGTNPIQKFGSCLSINDHLQFKVLPPQGYVTEQVILRYPFGE